MKYKFAGRKFRNTPNELMNDSEAEFGGVLGDWCAEGPEATLVTSLVLEGRAEIHAPVLDLDVEHEYVPSTRPGHGHLYLNVNLTREEHLELLAMLERFGIIERGFAQASRQRGFAAVRTPWTKKP